MENLKITSINELYKKIGEEARGTQLKVNIDKKLKEEIEKNYISLGKIKDVQSYLIGVKTDSANNKIISILIYMEDGRLRNVRGKRYLEDYDDVGYQQAWEFSLEGEPCMITLEAYNKYLKMYQDYEKSI